MNTSVGTAWFSFMICMILIGVAGSRLSRYGDAIAEKTGTGGTWIGLILLATVTSLPELMTGVSSVTLADTPDITLGDILGACIFNLMLIAILDVMTAGESLYCRISRGHILSAGFGIILTGIVGFNLMTGAGGRVPSIGHVGLYSIALIVLYAVAVRTVFRYEQLQRRKPPEETAERYPDLTLHQAIVYCALSSLVVVGAGLWLPFIGADLARVMGWEQSFIGTLFIAIATTVPETVVSIAALRLGAFDMAVSNLLGSNLFNVQIVAIDDLFYTKGPLLSHVAAQHTVSAFTVVIMSAVVIVGLLYRPRKRLFGTFGWTSLSLIALYMLNSFVLYLYGH
ncbi:MAG: putative calcium/sodium:proton antiporter [Syntrophus sp. PtaU1.Bin005]|nr:MAG: putative calcium/sodium:proton antiporter [Syntrophus sp. PtaU1.Bin005]